MQTEPNLFRKQRQLLRIFRQATTGRAMAEANIESQRSGSHSAIDSELNQVRQSARAQLGEATYAQARGRDSLTKANLQSLLDKTRTLSPIVRPGANPASELAHYTSHAAAITASIQTSIEALQQLRARALARRNQLGALAFLTGLLVVLLVVLLAVSLAIPSFYQSYERHQAALAALQATQEAENRLGPLYQSAVIAFNAGDFQNARALFDQVAAYSPHFKNLIKINAESQWQDTAVIVHVGEVVRITYIAGAWSGVGPEGLANTQHDQASIWPNANRDSLIGSIGQDTFAVGYDVTETVSASGSLLLAMNNNLQGANSGNVVVFIQIK